jgi:inorganic pyrophosphatase
MPTKTITHSPFDKLTPFDEESGDLNVVIETPKGRRNKFDYDPELGVFKLGGVMPAGAVFPFDFGFVPQTLGEDGDPLDVLVIMDEPAFTGCLLSARLIGVIEAEQTERDGKTVRNDRLLAVASTSHEYNEVEALSQLSDKMLNEIEHFFVSYNDIIGKKFKPLGRAGAERARKLVDEGIKKYKLN